MRNNYVTFLKSCIALCSRYYSFKHIRYLDGRRFWEEYSSFYRCKICKRITTDEIKCKIDFFLPENVTFFRETTKQTIVCLLISIVDYQYLNKSRAICRSKKIIACNSIVYMHMRHREWWINNFYYQKLISINADFVNTFFYFFHN